jgi:hypothetical protein
MRRALIVIAILAVVGYGLYAATIRLAAVECEACVEDAAGRVCRTVAGASQDQASSTALSNACAVLGRNVTERLACERRPPAALSCRTP